MSISAFGTNDSRRLESSLETKTGTFDQVVAVSQEALNDGLYYLFDKYEELQTMKVNKKKFGRIDASMSHSEVSLPVKSSNYRTLNFFCIFADGQLILTDDDGEDKDPIDVTDWRFAFEVDYTTLDVPSGTAEYQDVKHRLNQPGDYSIKRLFLDFKTAKIRKFNENLSDFQGHEWSSEDLQSFLSLLSFWGDPNTGVMQDKQKSTLGYFLTTDKPETVNPPAPTFPPTAMKHQHYKYIAPRVNEPEEGLEKGKNNMLLYLEMTQNRPFPREDILEYSGNFVEPGMKGTVCLSRNIFWDSYLLRNPPLNSSYGSLPPLLREFNRHGYGWLNGFHVWCGGYNSSLQWSFGFGNTNKEPEHTADFFAWERKSETKWEWHPEDQYESDSDKGVWPTAADGHATSENFNELWFIPGENRFHLKGHSKIFAMWNVYGFSATTERGGVSVDWDLTITMDSVSEGGLKLNMNLPANPRDIFRITDSSYDTAYSLKRSQVDTHNLKHKHGHGHKHGHKHGKHEKWDTCEDKEKPLPDSLADGKGLRSIHVPDITSAATDAVGKLNFESMTTNLQSALQNAARFVLPGGPQFFYKNPIFNNNGDLMAEAKYKSRKHGRHGRHGRHGSE